MTIKLVKGDKETILVAGNARSTDGEPAGPDNLRLEIAPGVAIREYVGADRAQGEHVGCDHGTLTFGAVRIFNNVEEALDYLRAGFLSEPSEGELMFDDEQVFPCAAVTRRQAAVVGRAVAVRYTIEG